MKKLIVSMFLGLGFSFSSFAAQLKIIDARASKSAEEPGYKTIRELTEEAKNRAWEKVGGKENFHRVSKWRIYKIFCIPIASTPEDKHKCKSGYLYLEASFVPKVSIDEQWSVSFVVWGQGDDKYNYGRISQESIDRVLNTQVLPEFRDKARFYCNGEIYSFILSQYETRRHMEEPFRFYVEYLGKVHCLY
jgi:hypothetical protein